ncbi:MAG: LCP family protein [Actinomycetota bacterium]
MATRKLTPGGRFTRTVLVLTAFAAILVAMGGGVGIGTYVWAAGELNVPPPPPTEPGGRDLGRAIKGNCDEESCNYLLLGSDDRAGLDAEDREAFGTNSDIGGEERSDTIIVVHTEPDQERATILSFPRDLWVRVPGEGLGKINSAFVGGIREGGAHRVAQTITDLTGLEIHHMMYVNLAGFQDVVDAVDGVDMCFPTDMVDPLAGLDLQAGCHHLDGKTALAVVRTRNLEGDCIPDFARITRQQQFFRALMSELLSPAAIGSLPDLVSSAALNLWIDPGLTPADLGYLASQLRGISTGQADFRAVPGSVDYIDYTPKFPNGVSIVRLDPVAEDMFLALREGRSLGDIGKELESTPLSPANVVTGVYDDRSEGKAASVLEVVTQGGFDVDLLVRDAAELDVDVTGSAIVYEKGSEQARDVVESYVGGMKTVEVPKGSLGALDVALVVTDGYEPVEPGEGDEPPASEPEC